MNLQSFHFAKCWKFPSTPLFEMENFGKLLCKRAPWTQWAYKCVHVESLLVVVVQSLSWPNANSGQFYWCERIENQSWVATSYYDSASDSDSNSTTAAIAKKRSSPIYVHRFVLYLFSIFSIVEAVAVPLPLGSFSFPFSFLCSRLNFPIN